MIDTLFLPRRVHVPFAKCPLYSRAIGVQKMCNLEFSTEGTRCSKQVSCSRRSARWDEFLISLSLSFPLLHLWINNPNPSQQSLLSMAAKMLENAPSSAFWVRISIRRPLEGRGSGPEQRQLSLSLFVFVVPAVRRISMWVNSVLDYARARMHDFQNEVSGGAHRTRRDTVSVLLQTKSKSLREGGGNCPRTIRGRWKFGIWDENRIRKKRIGWE